MKRLLVTILLLTLLSCVGIGRTSFSGPLLFETVSGAGSDLNSRIYAFVQDSIGYIWLGTDYGLLRYDGYRTTRINVAEAEYTNVLGVVGIQSLALAEDHSLWIGSRQGVFILSLDTWQVKRPAQFRDLIIRKLLIDSDSVVWVGTEQGLYKYNPGTDEAVHYNYYNSNLSQNFIESLYLDNSGNLWVGTADRLNVMYKGTEVFITKDLKGNYKPDITHNLILDIQPFSNGNDSVLFIGTETGLYLLNRYTEEVNIYNEQTSDLTNEVVKTIYAKDSADIYFGTDLGFNRLNLYTGQVDKFYHNPFNQYSIVNNVIWKVGPDKNGNLWLATSNGVSRVNLSSELFKYFPVYIDDQTYPVGTRVADVALDGSGTYWIATSSGIFSSAGTSEGNMEFSRATGISSLSIDNINTISLDKQQRLWIGSVAGINIWDQAANKIHIPAMDDGSASRVASNYISALFYGSGEEMWIGTWGGGLYKANVDVENIEDIDIGYIADFNGQIIMGKEYLWSLDGKLLYRFSFVTQKVEEISQLNDFAGDEAITSICYASDELLWIGSKNQLITYDIDGNSFKKIQMPIDEDFIVIGIIEDDEGLIWGASSNTLFRYDPVREVFNYFPLPERIPMRKLNLSPFRKTNNGEILACGFDGFLMFDPADFHGEGEPGSVQITSLKVNGEMVLPGLKISGRMESMVLPYGKRNLDFEYSSFQFNNIEHEQYAYMLDGYEDRWKVTEPGTNMAKYVNLPPGRYVFRVKDYTTESTEDVTTLDIQIKLPLWASLPFLTFYILLLMFISGTIIFQYRNRLKYRDQVSRIQIEKEQNEVLNTSKIRFFINISHELLTSIGLVIDPVKSLLSRKEIDGAQRNTLKLIERNAHFLKVYVDQLLNFRKIEIGHEVRRIDLRIELISFCKEAVGFFKGRALSKGVTLKLRAELKEMYIDTDEEKLYSILQNLLSNAIKFTPRSGSVLLSVKQVSAQEVVIEVKDSGIGIPEQEQPKIFERFYQASGNARLTRGTGIGLTIVKDFVDILNGRIELESKVGEGTLVRVTLPAQLTMIGKKEESEYEKVIVSREAIGQVQDSTHNMLVSSSDLPLVLIVDENRDLFEYIRASLKTHFRIIWASNGNDAFDMMSRSVPTIIISEIQLPDIDGISFCKKIRKEVRTSRVPFIFLTARTEVEHQLEAIEAGVDVFLAKPIEMEVLEANIRNLIIRLKRTEAFINRRLLLNAQQVEVDSSDDRLLKEVVQYIHKNITNSRITADEISYRIGISHSSLYRKIKSITGQSLSEFIRFVRLQKAEQLLSKGKLSVSEIMFQVGFTNHSYFSKCFKKLYNVTPKNYKTPL